MEEDSKEKILSDWNGLKTEYQFDNFDDLYRYIKRHAKTQGIPNQVTDPSYPNTKSEVEAKALLREAINEITSNVIEYRRRIKDLNKNRN